MSWVSSNAQNQRANQANGIFFTIDQHDLSHNVEAYAFTTTIPSPYLDFDDDNGDQRNDEAEVVSENTSFPTAGVTYTDSVYWSHWYTNPLVPGGWSYDPDGGTIELDENLSTTSCPIFCDKYDTHCCNTNVNWNLNRSYPANPLGLAGEPTSDQSGDPSTQLRGATGKAAPPGRSYRVAFGDSPWEVSLHADMSQGLATYARNARLLAQETIVGGSSEGVVTFNHPLNWDELAALEAAGLDVQQIEVVSAPDKDKLRWTIFVQNGPNRVKQVGGAALDAGVEGLGITAAYVVVPNRAVLERLERTEAVYLVDLSITDYRRHNPGVTDVNQNDLFWLLAGWD